VSSSDRDVVAAVRGGDRDAFAELVRRHQSQLFGLVLIMVRESAGAEDVTQDAFVRAFSHLDKYDDTRPFYPWLAAIATRLSQNWLHTRARTVRREGTAIDTVVESGVPATTLVELISDERAGQLWRAVAGLSSGERTAVVLHYRDGLPLRDVAQALGVTSGTIKTFLFRARRHLRERLQAALRIDDGESV
jgi:RNA polymerase sigma-70 factor (ECF subfamily)